MHTARQSVREIVIMQPSAAKVFQRFDIDLCSQGEKSLDEACAELQLSVDQVIEKLTDAEAKEPGSPVVDPASLPISRLIQHIVRAHHHYVRQELPKLAEMARKLADKRSDLAPELKNVQELLDELRDEMLAHIQKEEVVLFPFISRMDQDSVIAYPPGHPCFSSVVHPVAKMMQQHESANHLVAELRRLTHGFQPPQWACATHIALFAGLNEFEADLEQHVHLENEVLFPRAIEMEAELNKHG
ncbi:MAG TPA: DUF542 domain-containing protein [Terracidiphilus sp.]|jgi:regulator of cell morphogenesis and NO signaling